MTTTAGEQMRPYYHMAAALYPMYAPEPAIDDDFPYNPPGGGDTPDAITRDVDATHKLHICCRFDYPSAAGDPAWRALEMENTFEHEIGGHGFKMYLQHYAPATDWNERLWQLRGFPGTYAQATAANVPYRWDHDPNEVWGETGGAALAGRWTKPEKTFNYNIPADPLAMRAGFVEMMYAARPDLRPLPPVPPIHSVPAMWLGPIPTSNYRRGRRVPIDAVVWHHMAGFMAGADIRFHDALAMVSATYGVSHGTPGSLYDPIVQWVSEADTAYHAGGDAFNPAIDPFINDRSIGVELEDLAADDFTDEQYELCAMIALAMNAVYGVPLVRGIPGHVGHGEVPGVATACPGSFSVDRVLATAVGGLDPMITEARLREIIRQEATEPLEAKLNAGFGIVLTQKLRRVARYLGRGAGVLPRDPAGVGGTDTVGYQDDNTPLA